MRKGLNEDGAVILESSWRGKVQELCLRDKVIEDQSEDVEA